MRATTAAARTTLRAAMLRPPVACLLVAVAVAVAPLAPVAAQAKVPQDLEALALRVDAAHEVGERPDEIHAFQAALIMIGLGEEKAQAELSVAFLDWLDPQRNRRRPMIRYRLVDSARPVEQGRDREDYWGREGETIVSLRQKDYANDLATCQRNLKIARQILRFLDPGAVLRGLDAPTPVREEPLKVGRTAAIPALVVEGRLAAFPLRGQAGEDAPVHATIWVGKDDGRLLALRVEPIGEGSTRGDGAGEFLRFDDHRVHQGRLVPMQITWFDVAPGGARRAVLEVRIVTLDLGAKLRPEDLDRPR